MDPLYKAEVYPVSMQCTLRSRYKDTIVLSNGENVAPQPIEDNMVGASELVDQVPLCAIANAFHSFPKWVA